MMIAAGELWKKDKVCLKSTLCSLPVFRIQLSESVPTRMKKPCFLSAAMAMLNMLNHQHIF